MKVINLSISDRGEQVFQVLRGQLDIFEQQEKIRVDVECIPWPQSWSRLIETALYRNGPDVSEVGNSWVSDLITMDAVQPFSSRDIHTVIGKKDIFPNLIENAQKEIQNRNYFYSIPWSGDARAIFYRRDLLEKARIDEENAFSSTDALETTLSVLKDNGIAMPLSLPTQYSHMTVQILASWLWETGRDFFDPITRRSTLTEPGTLERIKKYFYLYRFLGTNPELISDNLANELFLLGQSAVTISGPWALHHVTYRAAEIKNNLALAQVPGIPYVGGNHLVIWKHARHKKEALKLLRFLLNKKTARSIYPDIGLPISEQDWRGSPFDKPEYQRLYLTMKAGRAFSSEPLWAMLEKRLVDVLATVWNDIHTTNRLIADVVESHITALEKRLEPVMNSYFDHQEFGQDKNPKPDHQWNETHQKIRDYKK
ncbi:MAG: extracellular solute-binding protein [Anaerolineales bacterium]|nr:extracellular solute-binding protein [Anaerolineales bacterium]